VIRIELDEPTLARTRIAISPLWETVNSIFLLDRHPENAPWPYDTWARHARAVLAGFPPDAAIRIYFGLTRFPDFIQPVPPASAPTIEEELAILRATPAEVIDAQLADYEELPHYDRFRPFVERREQALAELADDLLAYHRAALGPWWPAMRAALDEEVLYRARALAMDGPDALLADLHERIRWERPILTLVKKVEHSFQALDKRLLLVPLIFSRGALTCTTDDPHVVAVSYQARGAALLADGPPDPRRDPDGLEILVGRGRAAVLRALRRPATTAGIATELGLAPSTVSEHLSALAAAGVVHRRRVGRRVLYGLEPAGVALVTLLGDETPQSRSGPYSRSA
jgi:DNA-binding transcriptional ArsR family regulator